MGGLIWAYLGPEPAPLLPRYDLFVRDDVEREIGITRLPCNWLQIMENSLDPVHLEYLHSVYMNYVLKRQGKPPASQTKHHERIAFDVFEYGIIKRRLWAGDAEDSDEWQVGHPILFPNILSVGDGGRSQFQIRVPIDDTHTFSFAYFNSFVPGDELNAILVVRSGEPTLLTLSDRLRPTGPGFGVGWIHAYPAGIDEDVHAEATRVAAEAVRALGLRDGIAFPQLIVDSAGGVQLIEIAARVAAGQMADLVRVGTGIDLIEIALRQCTGERIADSFVTPSCSQPLAIRFFTAAPGVLPVGRVRSIDGLDEVRAAPGVVQTELYFGVGEVIRPVQVDADRLGYVIAVGKSRSEALELAEAATTHLHVRAERDAAPP